jgi:hypothetical protein
MTNPLPSFILITTSRLCEKFRHGTLITDDDDIARPCACANNDAIRDWDLVASENSSGKYGVPAPYSVGQESRIIHERPQTFSAQGDTHESA